MIAPDADDAAHRPACPRCQGNVFRVPRRFVDLLICMFVPVRRFRCRSMSCRWEGNLRNSQYFRSEHSCGQSYSGRFYLLEASRMRPVMPKDKSPR